MRDDALPPAPRDSPQRRDHRLTLARSGDQLAINGEAFDFAAIPGGAPCRVTRWSATGWQGT